MSGIAVIWNRDGRPLDPAVIVQMTRLMAHRGPDGEGHWNAESIAIGHCALNTTPESIGETQPLHDETGNLCLTFDGRIDNREELLSLLPENGSGPHSHSDAELVIVAYRKWGEECAAHLLGDFAFAIWDGHRRQLFCARDPLGVCPLFYAENGNTFVCASEIRSLFALAGLKKEPQLAVVTARLLGKHVQFDETLYNGIIRLPMAHCLTVTAQGVRRRRYWDIDPNRQLHYRSDGEYAEHFRELFFDAVKLRMRSRGPIAAMLSGGLDSSGIVCTAEQIRNRQTAEKTRFETFSLVFDRLTSCDERSFINPLLARSGSVANFHIGDSDPGQTALARRALFPDVLYSPQMMMVASMFGAIKERGFRVLLDGTGGDELAGSGRDHLGRLLARGHWLSLAALVREYATRYDISPWRLFWLTYVKPSIPQRIRTFVKRSILSSTVNVNPPIVRPDALSRTGAQDLIERRFVVPHFPSRTQEEVYSAIFTGWGPTVATDSYALQASYFGLEMRQPFRDRRIVEFALATPADQHWRGGRSRIVFRNAFNGILPREILDRRGKGMFLPMYDSVLAGYQRNEVRALFEDSMLAKLGIVDPKAILDRVEKYQGAPDIFSTMYISDLVALELHCRDALAEVSPGSIRAKSSCQMLANQ